MSKTFGNTVKSSKALVSSGNLTPQSRKSSAGTSIYASTVLRLVFLKTLHTYKIGKVEKIWKGSLDSIPSPSPPMKFKSWTGKFVWGVKAKHCRGLSTNFWKQNVYWHHPVMFVVLSEGSFPSNNLNFLEGEGDRIEYRVSS